MASEGALDARALFAAPVAIARRILARRIAEAGGRDLSRLGLEKIEALAASLAEALRERRAYAANVGGALVRLTAKGRLSFRARAAEDERQTAGTARVLRRGRLVGGMARKHDRGSAAAGERLFYAFGH